MLSVPVGPAAVVVIVINLPCSAITRRLFATTRTSSLSALRCRLLQAVVAGHEPGARDLASRYHAFESVHQRLEALLPPRHPLRAEMDLIKSDRLDRLGEGGRAAVLRDNAIRAYQEAIGVAPHVPVRLLH